MQQWAEQALSGVAGQARSEGDPLPWRALREALQRRDARALRRWSEALRRLAALDRFAVLGPHRCAAAWEAAVPVVLARRLDALRRQEIEEAAVVVVGEGLAPGLHETPWGAVLSTGEAEAGWVAWLRPLRGGCCGELELVLEHVERDERAQWVLREQGARASIAG